MHIKIISENRNCRKRLNRSLIVFCTISLSCDEPQKNVSYLLFVTAILILEKILEIDIQHNQCDVR